MTKKEEKRKTVGKRNISISSQLSIERDSPIPLYHQIAEQLEEAVRSGVLLPGHKIENELELAKDLGLSRPTIRQAIDVLVRKGLLIRRRGIGTQVANNTIKRRIELSSLYDDLKKSGMDPSTKVLEYRIIPASDELSNIFDTQPNQEFLYLERLRLARSEPLALMRNWIPLQLAHFSSEQLQQNSLYALLRASGHAPKIANQRFSATSATRKHASILHVEVGTPLLSMVRISFDSKGQPIEHADHLYIADSYAVEVTVAE